MINDSETLKKNVRLRLANINNSIAGVAKANKISRASMSLWIKGNPTLLTMGRLARVLGIPTFELINPEFNPREYPESNEADSLA